MPTITRPTLTNLLSDPALFRAFLAEAGPDALYMSEPKSDDSPLGFFLHTNLLHDVIRLGRTIVDVDGQVVSLPDWAQKYQQELETAFYHRSSIHYQITGETALCIFDRTVQEKK